MAPWAACIRGVCRDPAGRFLLDLGGSCGVHHGISQERSVPPLASPATPIRCGASSCATAWSRRTLWEGVAVDPHTLQALGDAAGVLHVVGEMTFGACLTVSDFPFIVRQAAAVAAAV